jgi:hypothetical protein
MLWLQRTAGNHYVQRLLEGGLSGASGRLLRDQPAATTSAVNPLPAIKALNAWRAHMATILDSATAWETANWIDYLGRTSSNPRLSLADTDLAAVASNTIGNVITHLGRDAIEEGSRLAAKGGAAGIGAMIGTALEPGGGTVIGFVVGVLIESAASKMFELATGKADAGEEAADAAERTAELILQQHALFTEQHREAAAKLEEMVVAKTDELEKTATQADVDRVIAWTEAAVLEMGPPQAIGPPYTMSNELLRLWVLEHAGNLGAAHGDTDATQWERAVGHVFEGGLEKQPTLFVYQSRAEWEKAGLDHAYESETILDEAEGCIRETDGDGAADEVQARFHGRELRFWSIKDPVAVYQYIEAHKRFTGPPIDETWFVAKAAAGNVVLYCGLDVRSSGESAYIDEWNWRVEIDMEPGELPSDPGPDPNPPTYDTPLTLSFDVWPTWG